ncbi:MAG: hypothetical protein ACLVGX_00655 [Oscillospiraceae bacterium]
MQNHAAKFNFAIGKQLVSESKGARASSQRPAGSQAAHMNSKSSHIVLAASPPGLFPFTALHIIENYGYFLLNIDK